MAPHAEKLENGVWVKIVPDTQHKPDEKSWQAKYAHALICNIPEQFREVADDLGEPCDVITKPKTKTMRYGSLLFEPKEKG